MDGVDSGEAHRFCQTMLCGAWDGLAVGLGGMENGGLAATCQPDDVARRRSGREGPMRPIVGIQIQQFGYHPQRAVLDIGAFRFLRQVIVDILIEIHDDVIREKGRRRCSTGDEAIVVRRFARVVEAWDEIFLNVSLNSFVSEAFEWEAVD